MFLYYGKMKGGEYHSSGTDPISKTLTHEFMTSYFPGFVQAFQ